MNLFPIPMDSRPKRTRLETISLPFSYGSAEHIEDTEDTVIIFSECHMLDGTRYEQITMEGTVLYLENVNGDCMGKLRLTFTLHGGELLPNWVRAV